MPKSGVNAQNRNVSGYPQSCWVDGIHRCHCHLILAGNQGGRFLTKRQEYVGCLVTARFFAISSRSAPDPIGEPWPGQGMARGSAGVVLRLLALRLRNSSKSTAVIFLLMRKVYYQVSCLFSSKTNCDGIHLSRSESS
jgi:hypothetical protein